MNRRTRIFTYKMIAAMIILPSVALALFGCAPAAPPTGSPTPPVNGSDVNSKFSISKITVDGWEITCLIYDNTNNGSSDIIDCDWTHRRQVFVP